MTENIFTEDNSDLLSLSMTHLLWLFSKFTDEYSKGWNSFMEGFYTFDCYKPCKIIPLPFLNSPASNYNTTYTVLSKTAEDNRNNPYQTISFLPLANLCT